MELTTSTGMLMNNTFSKFYDIYAEQNKESFSEEFLKSNSFEDIICPKFKDLGMRFAVFTANVQLVREIAEKVKISPQIYNSYSDEDKKKVEDFLNLFGNIIDETNLLAMSFVNLSMLLKECR